MKRPIFAFGRLLCVLGLAGLPAQAQSTSVAALPDSTPVSAPQSVSRTPAGNSWLNPLTLGVGSINSVTGGIDANDVFRYTDYIPVNIKGKMIANVGLGYPYGALAFYDTKFTFISSTQMKPNTAFTAPAGAVYLRTTIDPVLVGSAKSFPIGMNGTWPNYLAPCNAGVTPVLAYGSTIPDHASWWAGPHAGGVLGVFGHSISVPGLEDAGFSPERRNVVDPTGIGVWQTAICQTYGMSLAFLDVAGGRPFSKIFGNYPGISLTNMGALSHGGAGGLSCSSGATLAQDLAPVTDLVIWMGNNDLGVPGLHIPPPYPVGKLGDTAASNTFYGWVDNTLAIIHAAKPTIHVQLWTYFDSPDYNPSDYLTMERVFQDEGAKWSAREVSWFRDSGFNNDNMAAGVQSLDQLHPNAVGWTRFTPIVVTKFGRDGQ